MVSVIVPLYNKARYVGRALDSILAQADPEFEIVVVNDGSTDGSEDVVRRRADPRIRLVSQENAGVSAARNRGIAEARGELVAFLDADDEWLPGHLATIGRLAKDYPGCGVYASAYRAVGPDGREAALAFAGVPGHPWEGVLQNYFRAALTCDPVWTSAASVPKRVFETCGRFPVGFKTGEDTDTWCRIALKFPVAFSTRPGAVYHREAENRSAHAHGAPCPPVVRTLDDALSGSLPTGVHPDDLLEYRNKWLIGFATHCLLASERALARDYCRRASSTRIYRWWRLRNLAASYLPSRLLRAVARPG